MSWGSLSGLVSNSTKYPHLRKCASDLNHSVFLGIHSWVSQQTIGSRARNRDEKEEEQAVSVVANLLFSPVPYSITILLAEYRGCRKHSP